MGSTTLLSRSPVGSRFERAGLPVDQRLEAGRVELSPFGAPLVFSQPITFTPFASARRCSARCRFCSETLQHKESGTLSASLRPGPRYFEHLAHVVESLRELPMGISLSGLEATDDPAWLASALEVLARHRSTTDRVLYTNTNGVTQDPEVARGLAAFKLDRAEVSRHDADQARNANIMRFRPGEPAGDPDRFREAVAALLEVTHVRLVCVLQQEGVGDADGVHRYLEFARGLGVRDVVFRELSRIDEAYAPNKTKRYIDEGRVPIEGLLEAALQTDRALEPVSLVSGYYYWNLLARRGEMDVTFETSDYAEMKARHASGVVHKLIFHANGTLAGDWDPAREILYRPAAEAEPVVQLSRSRA